MPDPKFEQQVQQKMEELKFSPSPAVWKNLETELDKEKKRRRPIFWFFLFAGFGVAGAISYVTLNHHQGTLSRSTGKTFTVDPKHSPDNSGNPASAVTADDVQPANDEKAGRAHGPSKEISGNGDHAAEKNRLAYNNESTQKFKGHKKQYHLSGGMWSGSSDVGRTLKKDHQIVPTAHQAAIADGSTSQDADSLKNMVVTNDRAAGADSTTRVAAKPLTDVRKKDSSAAMVKSKKTVESHTKGWKFGLVFSPGISAQQNSLFTHASFMVPPVPLAAALAVPQSYGAQPSYPSVFTFRPAFSWSAGITVRKILSPHWDVSGAVSYHYSSTMVTATQPAGNIYNGSVLINSAYFNKVTDYRNSMHFIDIPVTAGYTLNKNSRLPVRIEGGLLVSEFLSGKGLQYDHGVYYGKYNTLNKTQLGATFGLQFGMVSGRNSFEFGPQIQYGLTDLMRATGVSAQHLLFGGITLRVMRKTK